MLVVVSLLKYKPVKCFTKYIFRGTNISGDCTHDGGKRASCVDHFYRYIQNIVRIVLSVGM